VIRLKGNLHDAVKDMQRTQCALQDKFAKFEKDIDEIGKDYGTLRDLQDTMERKTRRTLQSKT